jgi:Rieske 2Fe-2S family protein
MAMTPVLPAALADVRDGIARTREPLASARHLPGKLYMSPEVAALEKERIFLRSWLCVGNVQEIPAAGDYVTCEVAGEPFVLARQDDGSVAAFMNMCLHRGVAVAEGRGNTRDFSCPYHAWLYDIGGNLVAAPRMKGCETQLKDCRLRRLQSAVWRDWIFVSFAADPLPFEQFIGTIEPELGWFHSEQCRLADRMVIDVNCNWKLLIENLVDVYHVPVLHKGTFGSFVKRKEEFDVRLLPGGGWAYDQKAKPHSKSGEQTFPALPWLEGEALDTSSRAGIFPNITLSLRYDSLRMWQVWPLSIDRTRLHVWLLFAPAAFAQPDFAQRLEEYRAFIRELVSEDASMVVSLQNAMASPFYEPGPMSPLESAVRHVMVSYLDAVCTPRAPNDGVQPLHRMAANN